MWSGGDQLNAHSAWATLLEDARWFAGKGRKAQISQLTVLDWYTPLGQWPAVRSELATVSYPDAPAETYQLLACYRPIGTTPTAKVLARLELPGLGEVELSEATGDPEALLALISGLVRRPTAAMRWLESSAVPLDAPVRTFPGEQSNTSLLIGELAQLKVFRRLEPGPNLDVEILEALNGSSLTPALYGVLSANGTDLAMFCELVSATGDGWELATAACANETDYSGPAADLGRALCNMHSGLALAYPTGTRQGSEIASAMRDRLAEAVAEAPILAEFSVRLAEAFSALNGIQLPVQRVHGDFHLGQALRTSSTAWTIIDFEGEPLKSAAQRREPDSIYRDIAGALRSFDYATSAHPQPDSTAARAWTAAAKQAFLGGYFGSEVDSPDILRAYLLDKAIYEVRYELRNRPGWVHIPLATVQDELKPDRVEPSPE